MEMRVSSRSMRDTVSLSVTLSRWRSKRVPGARPAVYPRGCPQFFGLLDDLLLAEADTGLQSDEVSLELFGVERTMVSPDF